MKKPVDHRKGAAGASAIERQPRWYLIYCMLATLDVITVLACLTLNHQIMQIYVDSVAVNQQWAVRQGSYANLAALAIAVNAPGNDVFDSRNVAVESARLGKAMNVFNTHFDAARAEVSRNVGAREAALLLQHFAEIRHAMQEMVEQAELILGHLGTNQAERAGERMATMDRKYANVNRAFARLAGSVIAIQGAQFDQQVSTAESLKRIGYLIVGLVALMVAGALFYGSRILRSAQTAEAERRGYIRALTQARVEADAANRAKSRFLANVTHEIRTPMNTIFLALDMLSQSSPGNAQNEYVVLARSSTQSLLRLINDLLNLSKIEAGKIEFAHIHFELHALVRQLLVPFGEMAAAKGVPLTIAIAPDVPTAVVGDPTRIGEIVTNLADNAVKFTDAGSIQVSVSLRPDARAGTADTRRPRAPLRISVRDTGIGLSPEAQSRLFGNSGLTVEWTARERGGTGLGLGIARNLAKLMGGDIGVDSRLGVGSTMWFDVDLSVGDHVYVGHTQASAAIDYGMTFAGRRALLVEDNPAGRTLLATMLSQLGLNVDSAVDGLEAVTRSIACNYDVILMDLMLPVMNGFDATRRIRERERGCEEVPIIALTAQAIDGTFDQCLDAGVDDYLTKPFTRDELVAVLRRWL